MTSRALRDTPARRAPLLPGRICLGCRADLTSQGSDRLDASVLLAAFDPDDDHHEPARALLEDDGAALATLDLARYEVTNVAVRAWRAPELVKPLLAAIERPAEDGGVLASTGSLLTRAAEIAERQTISTYAAAAEEADLHLVSCDERDLVSKGPRDPPGWRSQLAAPIAGNCELA